MNGILTDDIEVVKSLIALQNLYWKESSRIQKAMSEKLFENETNIHKTFYLCFNAKFARSACSKDKLEIHLEPTTIASEEYAKLRISNISMYIPRIEVICHVVTHE